MTSKQKSTSQSNAGMQLMTTHHVIQEHIITYYCTIHE